MGWLVSQRTRRTRSYRWSLPDRLCPDRYLPNQGLPTVVLTARVRRRVLEDPSDFKALFESFVNFEGESRRVAGIDALGDL